MSSQPHRRVLRAVTAIAILTLARALVPTVTAYAATTYNVNSTTDSDTTANETACSSNAAGCTLRAAITDANGLGANASATINVPANTHNITAGEMDLFGASGQTITISGAGAASTIINGDTHHLIFAVNISYTDATGSHDLDYPQLFLSGLTVRNGRDDSTVSGNGANAGFGGGALIAGGYGERVTITNSVFQNNSANDGAGGAIQWLSIGDPAGGGTRQVERRLQAILWWAALSITMAGSLS